MKAADIMAIQVVTVAPETEVSEVAHLLLAHRVSAAPVVDASGHVLGMVSEGDLMRRAECGRDRSWWLTLFTDKTVEFVRTHGARARDVTGERPRFPQHAATGIARIVGMTRRPADKFPGHLDLDQSTDLLDYLASLRAPSTQHVSSRRRRWLRAVSKPTSAGSRGC